MTRKAGSTVTDTVAPVGAPFPTLSEQLAQRIADEILDDRFTPGCRLKEVDLAATHGVSRTSIREALRILDNRGLVKIEPRRGASVTQLTADEVDDLYEIRASLLAVAARRVATRRDPALLARSHILLGRAMQFATDAGHAKYFDVVYALSQLIAEGAGSERLASLIRSFSQQVARYTRLSLRSAERRRSSVQRWKRMLRAIELGDADLAEKAMRQLVTGSQESVRETLRERPRKEAA